MIKEPYRDYAVAAFRFFSACRKAGGCPNTAPELDDCTAVRKCIALWCDASPEKLLAVECVYMAEPDKPLRGGDIGARVRWCAGEMHRDERDIYRFLAAARKDFAVARGLRTKLSVVDAAKRVY